MSDDRTRVNPRTSAGGTPAAGDDPEATHWTAKDARETFGPGGPRQGGTRQSGPVPPPAGGGRPSQEQPGSGRPGQQQPGSARPVQGQASGGAAGAASSRGAQSRPAEASPIPAPAGAPAPATHAAPHGIRRTRKARLRISRIDPWSVMKTSLLFGVAGAIIFFVAVWVVWGVIGASGAFESMNKAVNDLIASPSAQSKFQLSDYVNTGRVLGLAAIIGAVDAVLFTALATLFSFLYNLAAQVMGGLEVTLAED